MSWICLSILSMKQKENQLYLQLLPVYATHAKPKPWAPDLSFILVLSVQTISTTTAWRETSSKWTFFNLYYFLYEIYEYTFSLFLNLLFAWLLWLLCLMVYQPFRLFNAKAILLEEQLWYYLTHSWEDKGVHTFP